MAFLRVSHIGICVTDLKRSLAFYRDLLGFEECSRAPFAGEPVDRLLGLEDARLEAVWLERDGTRIELLRFDALGTGESTTPRPMNTPGLTHLSLRVDDLDATLAELHVRDRHGTRVLEETRFDNAEHGIAAIFILDPDGTRVELVQMPGDPAALPGQGRGPAMPPRRRRA
ncbi:MAG: lactoylglutathione lyase [Myxococcales bacterium]|jgi:glyoxylase I family protein|nr:MAG: lactoylglutathione lyase [Myxococcales bacterium]